MTSDWKSQSRYIDQVGHVSYSHFDLRAQVLSKIERGYTQDLKDAWQFQQAGIISAKEVLSYFHAVKPLFVALSFD